MRARENCAHGAAFRLPTVLSASFSDLPCSQTVHACFGAAPRLQVIDPNSCFAGYGKTPPCLNGICAGLHDLLSFLASESRKGVLGSLDLFDSGSVRLLSNTKKQLSNRAPALHQLSTRHHLSSLMCWYVHTHGRNVLQEFMSTIVPPLCV